MRENLEPSLKLMFGDEGGYSNRKSDAGGPTKFGITAKTLAAHRGLKSVSAETVKNMKIDEAKDIYLGSYWTQSGGDQLPIGLDYAAFDFGVNSGPLTAVRHLQRVLKVKEDGWVGPSSMMAIKAYPGGAVQLIGDYCKERMRFLRSLKGTQGFPVNGRGWTIRVTGVDPKGEWTPKQGVVGNAIAMASAPKPKPGTRPKAVAAVDPEPDPLPAGGDAKAEPQKPNTWLSPEMVTTVGGGAVTAGGTVLSSGLDPIRLAIAVGIIAVIGIVAYLIIRRANKTAAVTL